MVIDETNFASYQDNNGAKITDVRNITPLMFVKLFQLTTEPRFIQMNKFYRLDANVNPLMGQDWFQRGLMRPDLVRSMVFVCVSQPCSLSLGCLPVYCGLLPSLDMHHIHPYDLAGAD
jgi:hypothetical protein